MSRVRFVGIVACLLTLTIDTSRLPGEAVQLLWSVVYFAATATFVAWGVTHRPGALTAFYGIMTVATSVRAVLLAVDVRFAGAALNVLLVIFLRDFVRARRLDLL